MHLMRRGKRIPQDVAVISRDNDSILDSASPTVAHYATPPAQLAARITLAVRQLIETDTALLPQIRLMPTFLPGESV
jgi:DNA-binding LacI/PurR family transcriptional regulator